MHELQLYAEMIRNHILRALNPRLEVSGRQIGRKILAFLVPSVGGFKGRAQGPVVKEPHIFRLRKVL